MAEQPSKMMDTPAEFWIFGYGSLIWKPPPHYDRRVPGFVEGYVRRFWQASEDHRGTPEAPGRVLTLIERSYWESLHDQFTIPEDHVWGVAYRIEASKVDEVKEYLDIREINGYSIQYTEFRPADSASPSFTCLVYIGMPDNPQFLGVQEPEALARHILKSKGPSGENKEYLFMVDTALQELSTNSGDSHVHDLAERVKKLARMGSAAVEASTQLEMANSASNKAEDLQEETEKESFTH